MSETHIYLSTNKYRQTVTNDLNVPQTGATVTMTLYNGLTSTSPLVTGETWPVTLTHVGSGVYEYTPPVAAQILPGRTYLAVSNADVAGVKAHSEVKVLCQRDSS